MTDTLLTAAQVLTAQALLAGLASLHPRLRPAMRVSWACVVGVAICLLAAGITS